MDFQHEYSNFLNSTGAVLLGILLYTALFGGWTWALLGAMRGSRSALIAALMINLLFLLVLPIGALVYTVLVWKKGYWGIAGRAYYTLVTIAVVAFVWFLNYWNLLGWRY